jgi:hypothetical protein
VQPVTTHAEVRHWPEAHFFRSTVSNRGTGAGEKETNGSVAAAAVLRVGREVDPWVYPHGLRASHAADTASLIWGSTSAISKLTAMAQPSVKSQLAGPVGTAMARKMYSEASIAAATSGIRAAPSPRTWLQIASYTAPRAESGQLGLAICPVMYSPRSSMKVLIVSEALGANSREECS